MKAHSRREKDKQHKQHDAQLQHKHGHGQPQGQPLGQSAGMQPQPEMPLQSPDTGQASGPRDTEVQRPQQTQPARPGHSHRH